MSAKKVTSANFDTIIGRNVRIYRVARHLSQTKLAEHLGLTFQQVQKYEKGINRIGSGRLLQIASFLDVPVMALFAGIEGGSSAADLSVLDLLAEPRSLRLAQAFSKIMDQDIRLSVVRLVEGIATKKRN